MAEKAEKIRVNMYLPKSLIDRIDAEALELGSSRSGVIAQRMSKSYLDEETQTRMNEGIKMMTGMDSEDVVQMMLQSMLKDMKKGRK
jgi:metal-responsive CopG/Arc/MetJ family transcriptional regulator